VRHVVGRLILWAFAASVLWGLGKNIVTDPGAGLFGAVVLAAVVYLARVAWPTVREHLTDLRPYSPFRFLRKQGEHL
jgi:hypothetical protein